MKHPRRLCRFVILQVAHQMPRGIQVAQRGSLPFPFLHAVLPKMPHSRRVRQPDGFRWKRLRHAHQRNLVHMVSNPLCGVRHALVDTFQIAPDCALVPIAHGETSIVACAVLPRGVPGLSAPRSADTLDLPMKRGSLIAMEGIDGSGKGTQVELLEKALAARGHSVFRIAFPQYDSWFGRMVAQFLNGEFGPLETVDPHFTAMLYAGDRFEAKPQIEAALARGFVVLADRYIGSNLAHQTARAPREKRDAFIAWIEHLEYTLYQLPRETCVIYLHVPPQEAHALIAQKGARSYTSARRDILEASLRHLEEAASIYDHLSGRSNWVRIECFDAARKAMRSPEEISRAVSAAVEPVLSTAAPVSK